VTADLTTEAALEAGLKSANTGSTRAVIQNPKLFAFVLGTFDNTLKLASGKPSDVSIGLTSKALATTKIAGKAGGSAGIVVGATAAQILVTTAGLISLAGKSPTTTVVAIGAAFAKKTSLALGLAGKDDKQAKCLAALTDLAASGLTTALVAPTAGTGIGAMLLAGSIAQLILSGYQVHQACIAPR
jgi:hypothetical protein